MTSVTTSNALATAAPKPQPAQQNILAAVAAAPAPQGSQTIQMPESNGKDLPRPAPEPADFSRMVENLSRYIESTQRNLSFRIDESSGRTVITVLNPQTQEIIRQIPSEELLAMARAISRSGSLFDALA